MNEFLTYMVEKLGRNEPPTPTNIAWNIGPKINAVFRCGNEQDRQCLLGGFVGLIDKEDALKTATRCHRRQTEEVKNLFNALYESVKEYKNCVVAFIDNENKEYTGLLAAKFMGKYNKPAFVLRKVDPLNYSGSCRSPVDILDLLNSSGLANGRGHGMAFGVILKAANLNKFFDWFDKQDLSSLIGEIPVTAIINSSNITVDLCKEIESHKDLYGQGIAEPSFYLSAEITQDNVNIYQKKTTTIKVVIDGVSFLLFMANKNQVEQFNFDGKKKINMIVTLNTNEFNGVISAQGKIKQFELEDVKENEFDWDKLFA